MGIFSKKKSEEQTQELEEASPSTKTSFLDIIAKTRDSIIDSILEKNFPKNPLPIKNAVMDFAPEAVLSASSFGQSISDQHLEWFGNHGFIGYQTCAVLSQHWLIDLACTVPVEDAVRKGWKLTKNDGEEIDEKILTKIKSIDKKMKTVDLLKNFGIFGRKYGVRVAVFDIESDQKDFYEHPFNIDAVKKGSYKGIIMNDPYYCIPILENNAFNPNNPDFYEPMYWSIAGKKYHKSHVVVFRHSELPQILKPSYIYGGISLTQQIFESVYNAELVSTEIPQLIQNMRQDVLHVDMERAVMNPQAFEERLQYVTYYKNNYGTRVIGDEETLEQIQTSLMGLDELCAGRYKLVASVAQMPVCKIMKTDVSGGLQKESPEEAIYHETLESLQCKLEPFLDRHYQLITKSAFGEDLELDVVWAKLDAMTEKEAAEVQLIKSQTRQNYALAGSIDGGDIRKVLINDKDSDFNGLELDDLPEFEDEEPPRTLKSDQKDIEDRSVSERQHRLMEAVAHNPEFAKKVGIPQSVGQEFAAADDVDNVFDAQGEHWVTIGGGESAETGAGTGRHVKLDGDGHIIAGLGGKFNGEKISEIGKKPEQKEPEGSDNKEHEVKHEKNIQTGSGTIQSTNKELLPETNINRKSNIIGTGKSESESNTNNEPWQISREKYFNDDVRVRKDVEGSVKVTKAGYEYVSPSGAGPFKGNMELTGDQKKGDIINAPFGKAKITSISKSYNKKLDNLEVYEKGKLHHRKSVEQALSEGKPVPQEVLADYPDLQQSEPEHKE